MKEYLDLLFCKPYNWKLHPIFSDELERRLIKYRATADEMAKAAERRYNRIKNQEGFQDGQYQKEGAYPKRSAKRKILA